ncbi:ABC transporter permease [Sporolactobacillus putidus]|uniref:Dipeptide transport system permease protein DppB n=1 Tax=Sporolactobacillus putidus TaxID=492735 RepID=A0A917W380_9BACL|nr:ABC transporter permease [Sporolactobacillus putidus]GGL62660.1 dipeptide transport system permease protein DppB [Sporolactobacillus putidus]
MAKFIIKRFTAMILTLWVITTLTFILMHAIPGSPFNNSSGKAISGAALKNMEAHYHMNQPLSIQYLIYLKSVATFNFGPSIKQPAQTVNDLLGRGFPVSFELGMWTLIVAILSGVLLGVLAALKHNGLIDYIAMTIAVFGISIPDFVLATMLIQEFAVNLQWFPAGTWQGVSYMILPIIALATGPMAIIARLIRSSMLEVLTQDYIRTAQAKGLSPVLIVFKHALKNALLPVVTVLGTLAAAILTGTFVIEKIFAIPGMGKYFVDSINSRDYPVIMGTTVFYSAILIVMLFLVDIAYGWLDPRIKMDREAR